MGPDKNLFGTYLFFNIYGAKAWALCLLLQPEYYCVVLSLSSVYFFA